MKQIFILLAVLCCLNADSKVNEVLKNTVVFIGDSISVGVGSSCEANRATSILCLFKKWNEDNKAISGMHLIKASNEPSTSVQDYLHFIPYKNKNHKYLIIALGVNDVGFNYNGWTSSLFNTQYRNLIANAYSKGWTKDRIICVNIYYVNSPTVWAMYNSYGIPSPATHQRYLEFRNVIKNLKDVATIKDPYYYFAKTIGNKGLKDGLHPNDIGYKTNSEFLIKEIP